MIKYRFLPMVAQTRQLAAVQLLNGCGNCVSSDSSLSLCVDSLVTSGLSGLSRPPYTISV